MAANAVSFLASLCAAAGCFAATPPEASQPSADAVLIREAIAAGRFAEAEQRLRTRIADASAPVVAGPAVVLENLRRIRYDYSLTAPALLAKLRRDIPDVTAEDLKRWRSAGALQHRMIDGEARYFRREPANLFRFCAEARQRRRPKPPTPAGFHFDLPRHLERIVALAKAAPAPEVYPVRNEVTFKLRIKAGNPRVQPGAKVRCWLPFPRVYRQQGEVDLIEASGGDGKPYVAPLDAPQRTLYFEHTVSDPAEPIEFVARYRFVTRAYCPRLDPRKVQPYDTAGKLYQRYTAPRPPHIVFSPEVHALVRQVCGAETNPLVKARKLFGWLDANVRYCSEVEYSTIPNLSAKALKTRTGDCGVQAMTFITLCRAAGIPARWQSGWETLPNRQNMHDWAEFYVEPWGWLPADPSYGLQDHPDPRVREFYCGGLDAYRMIVNSDYAQPLDPPKISYRSEPNDFQRGEVEIDGHNLYFDEWAWTFGARTIPLAGSMRAVAETLDAVVPRALRAGNIPGAVLAVGRKTDAGYDVFCKAYGYFRTEPAPVPMPADAVFDLASMTKPIATGTSLMILADRGRLSVDDAVGKYLPEFSKGEKKSVTIRQLMTHMSGELPYIGAAGQKRLRKAYGYPCREATRKAIRTLDLARSPGEAVVYSCLNAILCGEIVEVVSGQPLDEFAAENIFSKLGMRDTGFNPPEKLWSRCVPTTRAARGRGKGGFLQGQVHDPLAALQGGVSGNAGLFSTADDLARFAQMMLNGGQLDGVRILREKTVRQMTSVRNPGAKNAKGRPDRRGLLWDIYQPDAGDTGVNALYAYGHTGYTGTAIRIYPTRGVYVIALTNRVHPDDSAKVQAFRRAVWRAVGETLLGVDEGRPAAGQAPDAQGARGSRGAAP